MTYSTMFLLTYTPRDGAEDAGYARWIRQVDNPFFNGVPGIMHYSNWRFHEPSAGARFRYFDFMGLADRSVAESLFARDDVKAFTAKWRELWGRGPKATDLSVNAEIFLAERMTAGNAMMRWAAFVAGAAVLPDRGFAGWRIVRGLRSEPSFKSFATKFLANAADFDLLPPEIRASAQLAECFASPDRL
ncbi:MAG: hypothetical protein FJX65_05075 [Alphaproteobacteria bacterium]|nr:hypothetical protein [Alphaproteobacteria bacterium]